MYDLSKIQIQFLTETAERRENVSDTDYFGTEYKEYISNSLLKLINPDEGGAPTKFLEGFSSAPSPALELGSAVHQMILEKDKYFISEVEKPSGKVGLIIDTYHDLIRLEGIEPEKAIHAACVAHDYYKDKLTDAKIQKVLETGEEYYEFLKIKDKNPGSIVLTQQMRERFDGAYASVSSNPLIMKLLKPADMDDLGLPVAVKAYNEDVMVMDFEATIPAEDEEDDFFADKITLRVKAKIDNWTVDYDNKILTLNDLKTTGTPINQFGGYEYNITDARGEQQKNFVKGSFQKYHYYRQMAMYAFILKSYATSALGFDDTWTLKVNMLVVETNKPHMSHVFSVGKTWLAKGHYEFLDLIKRVSFHKIKGFNRFVEMDFDTITEI